jgi:N-acetylmuramoyl-L-alanine amidase
LGRKFIFILLSLLIICTSFQEPSSKVSAETNKITINVSVLNIRKGPGLSYPILEQVKKGNQFNVVQKKDEWYEINMPSGETGWVASWLVTLNQSRTANSSSGTVTVNGLRLRNNPSSDSSILKILQKDQVVKIQSQNGNWVNITVNGMNGWVSKNFLSINKKVTIQSSNVKGIVTVDHLNIRTFPSMTSDAIGTLNTGNEITILGEENGWIQISAGGQNGWISGQYVEKMKPNVSKQNNNPSNKSQKIIGKINVSSLNVRNKPSLGGKIIDFLTSGQSFEIQQESNNWAKIKLKNNQVGWIAGWYIDKTYTSTTSTNGVDSQSKKITILYNGTNLRSQPNVDSSILSRGNAGDSFTIIDKVNDWYKVQLSGEGVAYIASWVVSSISNTSNNKTSNENTSGLKGKTIVIDPGHGGQDHGTTGFRGTLEKNVTLSTAEKLYQKLKSAGANVILTRNDDHYVSLPSRVGISQNDHADAFISIHFDSLKEDQSVTGHTTYYYHSNQKELADCIDQTISSQVSVKDRGIHIGDFHVIRENNAPAVLLELGYLSNPNEEILINTEQYQELVTAGIYNGLAQYFK